MVIFKFVWQFMFNFIITFGVIIIATWGYNWIVHGSGEIQWIVAFRLALILSIVFTGKDILAYRKIHSSKHGRT